MKLTNKRLFLSAGTALVVAAPIVTVVSCGTTYEPTKEDMDLYRDMTSQETYAFVESLWQEKVISTLIDTSFKPAHEVVDNDNDDTTPKKVVHTFWTDNSGQSVKEAAEYVIRTRLASDPEYLKKMADTLAASGKSEIDENGDDKYSKEWLRNNGLLANYYHGITFDTPAGSTTTRPTGLTKEGLEFLFASDKATLKSDTYRFLITTWYLENTDKNEYLLAFKSRVDDSNTTTNKLIDPQNYLIIKEMISNKYFAKWELELTADQSKHFTDADGMFFDEAIQFLYEDKGTATTPTGIDEINSLIKFSDMRSKFLGETFSPMNDQKISSAFGNSELTKGFEDLIGYKGISSVTPSGTGNLSFSTDKMKEITNITAGSDGKLGTSDDGQKEEIELNANWDGFVVNNNLNRANAASVDKDHNGIVTREERNKEGIRLVPENGDVAKLTYLHGIMPIWNGNEFTFNLPQSASADEVKEYKHNVAMLIASLKSDYYADAVDFIRSEGIKKDGDVTTILSPIVLDVQDDKYEKILKDQGFKFIEVRKV